MAGDEACEAAHTLTHEEICLAVRQIHDFDRMLVSNMVQKLNNFVQVAVSDTFLGISQGFPINIFIDMD